MDLATLRLLLKHANRKELFVFLEQVGVRIVPDRRVGLYHWERGRRYRPTKTEADSGSFKCPHCHSMMVKVRIRKNEFAYQCGRCGWSIHRDDLWSPKPQEKPQVREPGDATGKEDVFEISVEESVTSKPPMQLV